MASTQMISHLERKEVAAAAWRQLRVYLELAKARLSSLVLVTAAAGYIVTVEGPIAWPLLAWTLLGTALTAAGANGLNQWLELPADRCMVRTRGRPLVTGRIGSAHAWAASMAWAALGVFVLAAVVNLPAAVLGATAILLYVLVYTPLKQRSSVCTLVGAVVGALPPLIGAAAAGRLGVAAWILAAILFVWQIPHSLALAWLYREDYARGGYQLLVRNDGGGRRTFQMILLYSLALVPVTLTLSLAGYAGAWYAIAALALGLGLVAMAGVLYRTRSDLWARRLFLATVIYLPVLLGVLLVDR